MRSLLSACGVTLLTRISENYERQSDGEAGKFGPWPPLALSTLLARRIVASPRSEARIQRQYNALSRRAKARTAGIARELVAALRTREGRKVRRNALRILRMKLNRGSITQRQYREGERRLRGDLDPKRAALVALAASQAKILRDTGRLLQSLTPRIGSSDQIFNVGPGSVEVGTNVTYFKYHQSAAPRQLKKDGTPRLPRRQVLPDPGQMPQDWINDIMRTIAEALRTEAFWRAYLGG